MQYFNNTIDNIHKFYVLHFLRADLEKWNTSIHKKTKWGGGGPLHQHHSFPM